MKKTLLPLSLVISLLWVVTEARGQTLSTAPADTLFIMPLAGDTLPTITMKFEYIILVSYFLVPGTALFMGWTLLPHR